MTVKLRKILFFILAFALLVSTGLFAYSVSVHAETADPFSMSAEGDDITSLEKTYGKDDSFVYTIRARFVNGQAAGVAFGITEDGAFVLNVDRRDNRVKLMYFTNTDGAYSATVLKEDFYIGHNTFAVAELDRVKGRVSAKSEFYLKVAVTGGEDPTVKCYVDDILRFDYDNAISLKNVDLGEKGTVTYEGGAIGMNVYASEVSFGEIYYGETDFTRYTELYRNQYHYAPFSGWNNDPNGLFFDGEYYHLYYQTEPFQKFWGDMYWGHARSTDLLTWENLPLALLPLDGSYMWSGSAYIDNENISGLFDSLMVGEYDGSKNLIIYYTEDGWADGSSDQDQWMAYSLDGGISFIKHKVIINGDTVAEGNTFRDPKVFQIEEGVWGIIVGGGQLRFYVSTNLTDWSFAGDLPIYAECPDIYKLPIGSEEKWVINIGGIAYLVGDLTYSGGQITFVDQFGVNLTSDTTQASDVKIFDLDNANASYATQTFYIDNANSIYNGKVVGISWYAGQPGHQPPMDRHQWVFGEQYACTDTGAQAGIRSLWNGGMTIPVEYSLTEREGVYLLRQTPISLDSISETVFEVENQTVAAEDDNILANVSGNTVKITASVQTDADRFGFRVFVGEDEYTEVGFDKELGYYLDRRNTAAAGTSLGRYSELYSTGIHDFVKVDGAYEMTVLLDWNGLEMFCEDDTQVFYATTYANYCSDGLEFFVDGEESAIVDCKIEKIASVYRPLSEEGKLTLSSESVTLDTGITTETEIFAYVSGTQSGVEWEIEDDAVIALTPTENGATISALASGETTVTATLVVGGEVIDKKQIAVQVITGYADTNGIAFSVNGVRTGEWHATTDGIVGQSSGDGFLLSNETYGDFAIETTVSVREATAAAIVFRADENMQNYFAANYDRNAQIAKVWSPSGQHLSANVGSHEQVTLRIVASGNEFSYYFNGNLIGTFTSETALEEGYVGLNVFNGKATFINVDCFALYDGEYVFNGSDVTLHLSTDSYVSAVYNFTQNNAPVPMQYVTQSGSTLILCSAYLKTLPQGDYTFVVMTAFGTEELTVTVSETSLLINDVILTQLTNVNINVGASKIVGVELNGTSLPESAYTVQNGVLTIQKEFLIEGLNTAAVILEGDARTAFSIIAPTTVVVEDPKDEKGWGDILFYVVGGVEAAALIAILTVVIIKRNKNKKVK
ncbi:MAG: glycoside hydrolase family 32 protein [Clostridia bacterium]|nr:glycoside hydrolase family 32 protein [Clostridia bacterium]